MTLTLLLDPDLQPHVKLAPTHWALAWERLFRTNETSWEYRAAKEAPKATNTKAILPETSL